MQIFIADIIPILLVIQSTIFSAVLLADKGRKRFSNLLLSIFFITLALQFSSLLIGAYALKWNLLQNTFCLYGFVYGPLLFFYSKSLIFRKYKFNFLSLLHFIPAISVFFLSITGILSCSVIGPFMYLSLLLYTIFSIKDIFVYREVLLTTHSKKGEVELKWLQYIILIFCLILFLDFLDQFIIRLNIHGVSLIHLSLLFLLNWMFYKGLKHPQIFLGVTQSDFKLTSNQKTNSSNKQPTRNELEKLKKLEDYLNETHAFTNPNLSLSELSKSIDITARELSYLINNFHHKNFMSFINFNRIQFAKERFKNPLDENETIYEVMYDSGFNSKSSFNTTFKKHTGLTPSEFKSSIDKA